MMMLKIQALFGRASGLLALLAVVLVWTPSGANAQGPVSVADLAEKLSGAVVNISTTQKVRQTSNQQGQGGTHQVPGVTDQFRDFFKDFFDNKRPN